MYIGTQYNHYRFVIGVNVILQVRKWCKWNTHKLYTFTIIFYLTYLLINCCGHNNDVCVIVSIKQQ